MSALADSTCSGRYARGSTGGSPLQEALLIRAQSRIVQLESEVDKLRQQVEVNKTIESFNASKDVLMTDSNIERLHKLEQERSDLAEELADVKRKLAEAETLQLDSDVRYQQLKEQYDTETHVLKTQVEQLMLQINELDSLNDEMQGELNEVQLLKPEYQLEQVEELKEQFSKSVEVLRARIAKLETVESQLLTSQAEVKQLQHQLRLYRQDRHYLGNMTETMVHYEALQHQVQKLTEENASLRQDRANADRLRFQVQDLQRQCGEMEGAAEEAARLRVENSKLLSGEADGNEGALATLRMRLAEFQQKEVVALTKYGDLASQYTICQQELCHTQEELEKAQKSVALEKAACAASNDRVNRLERKIIFLTKERDGCVDVLNSYKSDTGVDGLMKELLAEKEQEIERNKQRISELESVLEERH